MQILGPNSEVLLFGSCAREQLRMSGSGDTSIFAKRHDGSLHWDTAVCNFFLALCLSFGLVITMQHRFMRSFPRCYR